MLASSSSPLLKLGLLALTSLALRVDARLPKRASSEFAIRQANSSSAPDLLSPATYNASLFDLNANATVPGSRAGDAPGQYAIGFDASNGADDNSQSPQCSEQIFIGNAQVQGGSDQGWAQLPQVVGFDLKRDITFQSGTFPYYIESGKDATKIKRVIIVQPGKPRDSWKYTNLMRNALICAASNSSSGIDMGSILIVGPAWLAQVDQQAGAAQENDLVYNGSAWAIGAKSVAPVGLNISTFQVMDTMVDRFFDKTKYPNLNNVVIAGHSLGAAFAQRYAVLREPTADDPNLITYHANCGSYVWPTASRPFTNDQCSSTYDIWTYGLNATNPLSIPLYRRDDVVANKDAVIQQWLARKVITALGTADFGPGDQHCEAQWQGNSHYQRGQEYVWALGNLTGGMPTGQSVLYVDGVSHQDYLMFSAPASMDKLFVAGIDDRAEANKSYPTTSPSVAGAAGSSGASLGASRPSTALALTSAVVALVLCSLVLP